MPDYALTYTLLRELLEATKWTDLSADVKKQAGVSSAARYVKLLDAGAEAHPDDAGAIVSHLRDAVLNL